MTYELTTYYIIKTKNSIIHTLFRNILVCFPPILKEEKILIMHFNGNQIDKNAFYTNRAVVLVVMLLQFLFPKLEIHESVELTNTFPVWVGMF